MINKSIWNKDRNTVMINSGKKIFSKQLQGNEGKDLIINEIPTRGIILNHLNDMSTTQEDRGLNVSLDTDLQRGYYIKLGDKYFMVTSKVDDHYYYKTARIRECEHYLTWKGINKQFPCFITNSSYGSKGEITNIEQESDFDSRGLIFVQKNEYTDTIYNGMRFIFNRSKNDVYEVTKVQSIFGKSCYGDDTGYYQLVCKYVKWVQGDDFENNIAFNPRLENTSIPTIPDNIYVNGSDKISILNDETYTIVNTTNVTFELDEDTVAENIATIISQNGTSCVIKALVPYMPIALIVKDSNGVQIAIKSINTVK